MSITSRTCLVKALRLSATISEHSTQSLIRPVTTYQVRSMSSSKKDAKNKTAEEWQKELTAEQYYVAREGGTEPPFSGVYNNHHAEGIYQCVCCGTQLFSSKTKFESGCGWPSFHTAEGEPTGEASTKCVATRIDRSHRMVRTEVLCENCDAHLGHVFPDGPDPTGLRYCINSASLKFITKKVK